MARRSTSSTPGGSPGRRETTDGGAADSCAYRTAIPSSWGNGGCPDSNSNAAQASAYSSVRPSTVPPWICSGAQ